MTTLSKSSAEDVSPRDEARPRTVEVLLPLAVGGTYTYRAPRGMALSPGDVVRVPIGPREALGVVWEDRAREEVETARLRPVSARLPTPPLPDETRRFVEWVADYNLADPGAVLKMVLRTPDALFPPEPKQGVRATGAAPERMTGARERVLAAAEGGLVWLKSTLAEAAGVSTGVIDSLVKQGALAPAPLPDPGRFDRLDPAHAVPQLTGDQREAGEALAAAATEGFSVTLLDGVTGAGKTEAYFEAVAAALAQGRQALILLPEIALTAQFMARFKARFGGEPAPWHSDVPPRQREAVWRGIHRGEVQVVVGARSALFLPFQKLGLIVVDEEHDPAYKQEERVVYQARDMAVVRAQIAQCAVVLASATPSIESRVNAEAGRYRLVSLPERYGGRSLPQVEALDLRAHPPERGTWIAPPLASGIAETLARGEQALLFLNRRGYAPLTLCRTCGHRFACPNCSAWLTEHRFRRMLICHHCGHEERSPHACPECGAEDTLVALGPGVERIAEEAAARFPTARITVLSSDVLHGVDNLRRQFEAVERGETDLVIGTQLIAKGHNFPHLTLVGVLDADMGFGQGDLRAAERTFQLLSQVVGRAGRGARPGRALLQTYMPEHPVLQALVAGDREAFYAREIQARQETRLPPFARLAAVIVSAEDRDAAEAHARRLARHVEAAGEGVLVLGPAEAPLAVLKGRHRFRLLVKAPRAFDLQDWIRRWLALTGNPKGGVRRVVDIDPYGFL